MQRNKTKPILIKDRWIGGDHPILIQSMNNTDTRDIKKTLEQISRLAESGCEITRVAVPDRESALAIKDIVVQSPIPVVADIHFDYRLAIQAIESGAHKIRINPGNLGGEDRINQVAAAAKERGIPIRVGVNSGSVDKDLIASCGGVNSRSMSASAIRAVRTLEKCGFEDIVVSIKSSDVPMSIESYRQIAGEIPHPLHIGITEAGTINEGSIRSAVGIGALLAIGIGDTLRVSLTGDPVKEVETALRILRALELRESGIRIVSCPTCARTQVPLIELAEKVEKAIGHLPYNLRVAVMGCAVNGPGEARESDIGIAGGKDSFLLFREGRPVSTIPPEAVLDVLSAQVRELGRKKKQGEK